MDKKDKIFQEAAELFSRDGFYKVSVREICEAAGVTKPVLYYYFNDKENLLFEMMKETRKIVDRLVAESITPEMSFDEQLEGIVNVYIRFQVEYPHLMKFSTFVQFMSVPEKIKKYKYDAAKEDWDKLVGLFASAQKEGILSKNVAANILAQNFLGSIIVILTEYMMEHISENQYKKNLKSFLEFWKKQFLMDKT